MSKKGKVTPIKKEKPITLKEKLENSIQRGNAEIEKQVAEINKVEKALEQMRHNLSRLAGINEGYRSTLNEINKEDENEDTGQGTGNDNGGNGRIKDNAAEVGTEQPPAE